MKIALLQPQSRRYHLFTDETLKRLASLGELTVNTGEADEEDVKKAIRGADIAVTAWGNTMLTKAILDEAPDLKFIVHAGGSVKVIIPEEVWERDIKVASSNSALAIGVAESALGMTISASKNFYNLNRDMHSGVTRWNEGKDDIVELYEITVGVISAGCVGRHYIKLLNNFDVDILLYDPFVTAQQAEAMGCRKAELDELLSLSDIVSVHAPSLPETYHMFNSETLKLMKKDAVLINTSRGAVIDEEALVRHMQSGNLKYACLDVFEKEPLPIDSPLRSVPNIILTPHLAGLARNGRKRIGVHAIEEVERFIRGEESICPVRKEMLDKMA